MPPITRKGDKSTGHDSCAPVRAAEGAENFLVNGRPVVLVGDKYEAHGCENHGTHQGTLAGGSSAFLVNGRAVGRVGDPISCGGTVAEGSGGFVVGSGNEQKRNKALCKRNEAVTRYARSREDDIFFCLPLIADAVGNAEDERDRIGWHYLRDMFYKWLAGEANDKPQNNPSPFWVDIDWVLSYPQIYNDWLIAINEKIFNKPAEEQLLTILEREGYFREETLFFDFINIPWQEWERYYYQHVSIDSIWDYASGVLASLGDFVFKFLPKGILFYSKENGYEVELTEVAGFVYDVFAFEDEQFLGYWSCVEKNVKYEFLTKNETYIKMNNAKFNAFREQNKVGNDFLVLSQSKIIDITDKNSKM